MINPRETSFFLPSSENSLSAYFTTRNKQTERTDGGLYFPGYTVETSLWVKLFLLRDSIVQGMAGKPLRPSEVYRRLTEEWYLHHIDYYEFGRIPPALPTPSQLDSAIVWARKKGIIHQARRRSLLDMLRGITQDS